MDRETGGREYFREIEAAFLRLRGAPLVLSPEDWRLADDWYRRGIPIDLVRRSLESVFATRKERRGRINSLRYCAAAVEEAWSDQVENRAGGSRETPRPIPVSKRLAALAAALPGSLEERDAWSDRIVSLQGTSEEIEAALATLDAQLLRDAWRHLEVAARQQLERSVDSSLASLGGRLTAAELDAERERLARPALRRLLGLPMLSLFSPEARAADR